MTSLRILPCSRIIQAGYRDYVQVTEHCWCCCSARQPAGQSEWHRFDRKLWIHIRAHNWQASLMDAQGLWDWADDLTERYRELLLVNRWPRGRWALLVKVLPYLQFTPWISQTLTHCLIGKIKTKYLEDGTSIKACMSYTIHKSKSKVENKILLYNSIKPAKKT